MEYINNISNCPKPLLPRSLEVIHEHLVMLRNNYISLKPYREHLYSYITICQISNLSLLKLKFETLLDLSCTEDSD